MIKSKSNLNMIVNEMKKYPVDFIVLLIGLVITLVTLMRWAYSPDLQIGALVLMVLFYFAWGVLHHLLRGSLSLKIVVEYASFSLVGLVLGLAVLRLF